MAGFCARSCNRWPCPFVCEDIPPPGGAVTCADQLKFGKCDEDWMLRESYCAATCERCRG